MPTLSEPTIANLLTPYLAPPPSQPPRDPVEIPGTLYTQLSLYLDLLLKWNARTNLTAIRDPEEIVRRHFGESLFAALYLGHPDTLLDLGSGAGFPGLPIALLHPETRVTLAESQNKKATFLREAVRTLSIPVEVWANRAEALPQSRRFHTVALRAVDNMPAALAAAEPRATHQLLLLVGDQPALPATFTAASPVPIPNTQSSSLLIATRT